ncbi:hypothetical protein K431DRAFT_287121 [Polychaeton citri CBS 116435]|uniref:Uncharacterized protein n=1 Tax=Polychaeton citri CBS 116435 TaxID=1314669 RepID=A0A9P4Q3H1_9PEZI|nr:hypothetical protein K431DRAFT_287121 [Polychaeton citri CBS 116435]
MCCRRHRERRAARHQAIAAAALAGYAYTKSRFQNYQSSKQIKNTEGAPEPAEMDGNGYVANGFSNVAMSEKGSAAPPSYTAVLSTSSPVAMAAARDNDAKSIHSTASTDSEASLGEATKAFVRRWREKREMRNMAAY